MSDLAPQDAHSRDHCSQHHEHDPTCHACREWADNPRSDLRLAAPISKDHAHRRLAVIFEAAKAIDAKWDDLHDAAYARGVYGAAGGSGHSDGVGAAFVASQAVRDQLSIVSKRVTRAYHDMSDALRAHDEALRAIDRAHPLYLDHKDEAFGITVTPKELLRRLEIKLRDEKAQHPEIGKLENEIASLKHDIAEAEKAEKARHRAEAEREERGPREKGRKKGWRHG